jgi:hypothetical protein
VHPTHQWKDMQVIISEIYGSPAMFAYDDGTGVSLCLCLCLSVSEFACLCVCLRVFVCRADVRVDARGLMHLCLAPCLLVIYAVYMFLPKATAQQLTSSVL